MFIVSTFPRLRTVLTNITTEAQCRTVQSETSPLDVSEGHMTTTSVPVIRRKGKRSTYILQENPVEHRAHAEGEGGDARNDDQGVEHQRQVDVPGS